MHSLFLKISSILWVIWGLVHILAGILTMGQDATGAVKGIADGVDPTLLEFAYPEAAAAIINQHGFNLAWIGLFTVIGAIYIWKQNTTAVYMTAIVSGLTDIGYFVFIDLGGFNNFAPGTVMTIISATAVILSIYAIRGLK